MTLELANRDICTPKGIARDVFVPVGKFTFSADFVIVDYESDLRVPLILGRPFLRTARALIDVHGEEMILCDGNDDLPFDAKSDLLELECLLNHDPIKDMDSILEDSVDENSLDDNLDDTISEEFTDEPAPSESFPPGDDDMTPKDVIKEVKFLLTQSPLANYSLDNDVTPQQKSQRSGIPLGVLLHNTQR
ncbi:reverse transcriptase domain-containing protein [Tanacetum coccineum]